MEVLLLNNIHFLKKQNDKSGDKVFIKTEGKDITLPNLIGWSKKSTNLCFTCWYSIND